MAPCCSVRSSRCSGMARPESPTSLSPSHCSQSSSPGHLQSHPSGSLLHLHHQHLLQNGKKMDFVVVVSHKEE